MTDDAKGSERQLTDLNILEERRAVEPHCRSRSPANHFDIEPDVSRNVVRAGCQAIERSFHVEIQVRLAGWCEHDFKIVFCRVPAENQADPVPGITPLVQ